MMRRTIAVAVGLLVLVATAMLPTMAGAQQYPPGTPPPSVSPSSVVPPQRPTTTRPSPSSTRPPARPSTTTTSVLGEEAENTSSTTPGATAPGRPAPQVQGDVVTRPLPRTGNDIGGTAIFGGALTVLGVALALGARKRRNSFDGV